MCFTEECDDDEEEDEEVDEVDSLRLDFFCCCTEAVVSVIVLWPSSNTVSVVILSGWMRVRVVSYYLFIIFELYENDR